MFNKVYSFLKLKAFSCFRYEYSSNVTNGTTDKKIKNYAWSKNITSWLPFSIKSQHHGKHVPRVDDNSVIPSTLKNYKKVRLEI